MTSLHMESTSAGAGWRRTGVLVLAVAAVGLPINNGPAYLLVLIAAVVIFSGKVSTRAKAWL
ncbi:MAG: hypothetical protein KGQ47_16000, partial [Hyphomicrobiales bacterium]|nr:hypothetical protein [Hyphomicrobiales bacterium]